jgi:hypothetical protein
MSYPDRHPDPDVPSPPPRRSGIELSTLLAAAVASVVAALVVSRIWQAGTIMATAMTPVIVALVKEAVERPARRVSSVAARSAPRVARTARVLVPPPPEAMAPPPPVGPDPELTELRVYGRQVGRRWKAALLTGLLAFLVCVAALTLPELLAGHSVVSTKHDTTLFGGHRSTHPSRSEPSTSSSDSTPKTTTSDTQTQTAPTTSQPTTSQPAPTTPTTPPTETAPPAATAPQPTAPPTTPPTPPATAP